MTGTLAVPTGIPGTHAATDVIYQWVVDHVRTRYHAARATSVPIYLAGEESNGDEIALIRDAGLVKLTEADTIADSDSDLVVAATSNMLHFGFLKKKVFGLHVTPHDLHALINTATTNSTGPAHRVCRGAVVNMDELPIVSGSPVTILPAFEDVARLCDIRSQAPAPWTLCFWTHPNIEGGRQKLRGAVAPSIEYLLDLSPPPSSVASIAPWLLDRGYDLSRETDEFRLGLSLLFVLPLMLAESLSSLGWQVSVSRASLLGHDSGDSTVASLLLNLRPCDSPVTAEESLAAVLTSLDEGVVQSVDNRGRVRALGGA